MGVNVYYRSDPSSNIAAQDVTLVAAYLNSGGTVRGWTLINNVEIDGFSLYFNDGSAYEIPSSVIMNNQNQAKFNLSALAGWGGEPVHRLSVNEMPTHAHELVSNINYPERAVNTGVDWGLSPVHRVGYGNGNYTNTTGGSMPHNNMPPYITAYCWRRID
jgi:hypothetical protein